MLKYEPNSSLVWGIVSKFRFNKIDLTKDRICSNCKGICFSSLRLTHCFINFFNSLAGFQFLSNSFHIYFKFFKFVTNLFRIWLNSFRNLLPISEAAAHRCFENRSFFKMFTKLRGKQPCWSLFLLKLQVSKLQFYLKENSATRVFF